MTHALQSFDPVSVHLSIARITEAIQRGLVTQSEICEAINIERSKFSRWINRKSSWRSIGRDAYFGVLRFAEERNVFNGLNLNRPYSHLLSGLSDGLNLVSNHGFDDGADLLGDQLIGCFAIYRFSHYASPNIIRGSLEILRCEETNQLKAVEICRVPSNALGHGSTELNICNEGHIFAAKNGIRIIQLETNGGRDMQVTYVNKYLNVSSKGDKGTVHLAEGLTLEWVGTNCHIAKTLFQRLENKLEDSEIQLLEVKDIPETILTTIRESFQGPHTYLRLYR